MAVTAEVVSALEEIRRNADETALATYAHLLPHSDELAAETVAAVLVDKPLTDAAR